MIDLSQFSIYVDAEQEGGWFKSLSHHLEDAELMKFQGNNVPSIVEELTDYDRPDIILLKEEDPVLVVEKTGHVPTGKNPLQRVARMVKSAERGVPGIFFTPYAAMKHGKHSSKCNANYRLIQSLRKIGMIHDVEMLIPPWPTDDHYELIRDGSENELLSEFMDQFLSNGCDPNVPAADKIKERTEEEVERILDEYPLYERPPRSVEIVTTQSYLEGIEGKLETENPRKTLNERHESVVCTFDMSPRSCGRVDPYGGAQFVYDYLYCRTGPNVEDRKRNLILQIPRVSKEIWLNKNPYKPENKSSLWYKCADGLELKDSLIFEFEKYRHQKRVGEF